MANPKLPDGPHTPTLLQLIQWITRPVEFMETCANRLRIYPIVFLTTPRIVKSPIQIMGYEFEPGTMLAPCIYLTHRREDLYPQAEQFRPERFLERQFSPYEYLPFGGGNRRCIGAAFSLYEMKLVLASILSRFELALADPRPVSPVRRGLTMAPAGDLKLVVKGQRQDKERLPQPVASFI
jgi:cytochrome P450